MIISGIETLNITAFPKKELTAADFQKEYGHDDRMKEPNYVVSLHEEDVESVEEGFLDFFPNMYKIIIPPNVKKIGISANLAKMLSQNKVIIRGEFDSLAEEIAQKYHLTFIPMDIELASTGDYFGHGFDVITLRFLDDGTAMIRQDELCQGSSAGSSLGGVIDLDINWDFFTEANVQERIADMCWGNCRELIRQCEALKVFLEKANKKYESCKHSKLIINY